MTIVIPPDCQKSQRKLAFFGIIKPEVIVMLKKEKVERNTLEMVSIEHLVPLDHLLRKIDMAVDFNHIYDFVEDLYCADNGRPSVDPVVLFKMVLIQHLYGIPSLRRTVEEINMNIAYRWFLGYLLNEPIPHFATISYNFRHRFTEDTIEEVFRWILFEAQRSGYLSPEVVFIDGTHIKANANVNKKMKKAIPAAARIYEEQLMKEINEDRQSHGKKPFDGSGGGGEKEKEITVSTTDPESGMFHKGEHKRCFAYEAHTVCDKHNFVLDTVVTSGNVHDSVAFDELYDKVTSHFPEIKIVTMDAGYKTPWICKKVIDDDRIPSLPYKRPMTKEGFHEWYKYVYDEYLDIIICPEYKSLKYSTTNRDGYREYKSLKYQCEICPTRHLCTESQSLQKTVTRHIWADYLEMAEDIRYSPAGRDIYKLRSQTIERVFADAKEKYGMRYTPYRGLKRVSMWVRLKFAAMNLKKLAMWRWKDPHFKPLNRKNHLLSKSNPYFAFA